MSFNVPYSGRLIKICTPVVASLLLFAPGCGHDHCSTCSTCTNCVSDSTSYRAYETPPQTVYQSAPVSAPPVDYSNSLQGLRGPRSQAELDAVYGSTQVQPLPPMPPPRPPMQQAPCPCPQENLVIVTPGDATWNVPISREWKHIVVHHSASPTGNAASFDRAHRDKGWDGLGYHFVIGNGSSSGDGQVEVGYRWTKQMQGAHAGNYEYNQHGIGICLVGDFEHGGPPSSAQMASLRTLVSFLQSRANIPPNEIIGHGNVPGRNTECPGRNLDMAAFRNSVGGAYIQRSNAPAQIEKGARHTVIRASESTETMTSKAVVKAVALP